MYTFDIIQKLSLFSAKLYFKFLFSCKYLYANLNIENNIIIKNKYYLKKRDFISTKQYAYIIDSIPIIYINTIENFMKEKCDQITLFGKLHSLDCPSINYNEKLMIWFEKGKIKKLITNNLFIDFTDVEEVKVTLSNEFLFSINWFDKQMHPYRKNKLNPTSIIKKRNNIICIWKDKFDKLIHKKNNLFTK